MNHVEAALLENIDRPGSLFVFPTDIAVSRWVDRLLRLRRGGTVPTGKFTAWDTFKRNSVKAKVQNKKSIHPALRKMFVAALIRENAELCARGEPPFFSSLIRPEWAEQAASFAGWITNMLSTLGKWFCKTTKLSVDAIHDGKTDEVLQAKESFIGDDKDLFSLTCRYAKFLKDHGLFEPAWEIPPFDDAGKECFIFFPEALFDFEEYRELLESSGCVKMIRANDSGTEQKPCDVFFYTNSRSEITEAALYILALHYNKNIPWDSISVSIPDNDSGGGYGPYLFREFTLRNIPFVKLSGKPLASFPAGRFFSAIANCVGDDFSFTSVTELLLNNHLPWKGEQEIQSLIQFGIKNNCISSWTEAEKKINVWEDSFSKPFGGFKPEVRQLFRDLRQMAASLRSAASFADIRKKYFIFREHFFNMENCLEETDLVLSRCISELTHLVELEKSFPDIIVPDPYAFFTGHLEEVEYLARQSASGVAVLPYRTAAPAPFDCHIILGANQDNLSALFTPMKFLPKSKREKLGISDNDMSLAYINLHRFNSRLPAAFFCSEQTFSGYAIAHNALNADLKPRQRFRDDAEHSEKFSPDLFRIENDWHAALQFLSPLEVKTPLVNELHKNQKQGFDEWRKRRIRSGSNGLTINHPLQKLINRKFCKNDNFKGKVSVSPSSLELYFQCPLKWIYKRVLELENIEIETGLMAYNIGGEVYHAILNLFLDELIKNGKPIIAPIISGDEKKPLAALPEYYRDILVKKTEAVFENFPYLPGREAPVMSMLTARLLTAEKQLFFFCIENFLATFISYFSGFRVIASEKHYIQEKDFYYLNGKVDCILEDIRENSPKKGTAVIADFKTKTLPKLDDCRGEVLADFQLPAYLRITESAFPLESALPLESKAVCTADVHTALFFSIVDSEPRVVFGSIQNISDGSSVPPKADDCIARESDKFIRIMEQFDDKAEQFAEKISEGTYAFYPNNTKQCLNCGYNRICRTAYRVCRGKNNGS